MVEITGEPWSFLPPQWTTKEYEEAERRRNDISLNIIKHGEGLYETWASFAFQEPPKDFIGRIIWTIGLWGQMVLSIATFPAALAAFLLEEAVQTYGMGAYMLSTAGAYDILEGYLDSQEKFIEAAYTGAKTLAGLSPVTGGAVLIYLDAAKKSTYAFQYATNRRLLQQAETDEAARKKLADKNKYAILRLQSSPSQAEIWMNGVNTNLLTPETFKDLDAGVYTFLLKKYSALRNVEETFEFTVNLEAGWKKEIMVRIPKIIDGVPEDPEDPAESEEPQLPPWINAQVKGDHAIDGDTFVTTTGERIRILAIDAPEGGRPWADESREALGLLIEDKNIELRIQTSKPLDQYGRTLAVCSSYKGDIAVFQLSSGLARLNVFDDDIYDPAKYIAAEQIAKDRKIGIWS